MTSWNPLTVLSGITRANAERAGGTVPLPHPLGFADVRAQVAPAPTDIPAPRPTVGFVSPEGPAELVFRTELSFRRRPLAPAVARNEMDEMWDSPAEPVVGHAAPASGEHADDAVEPEPSVPFYKREIGFFRRKHEDDAEPADVDDEPLPIEIVAEPVALGSEADERELLADPAPVLELQDEPDDAASWEPELELEIEPQPDADEPYVIDPVVVEPVAEAVPDDDIRDEVDGELEIAAEPVQATEPAADELDLWDDIDDVPGIEPSASADVADGEDAPVESAEELEPDDDLFAEEHVPVTAVSDGRRSLRLRAGGPKPKKRRGSRGDRGGRKVVGLKIGASQLAAAVVQQVDGRSELVAMARVPLEPGIVVDGDVKDRAALTHALKSFFDEHALPRRDVRIGLASNRIGVRTFDIAGVDEEERFDNAVRFKAHEVLPVAVHESLLDYRVIDERANEEGETLRRVLLVVAPRDQVEPYLDVCKEAGVRLGGIDLEALGLLRAFVEPRAFSSRTADDTATVVVAIGHEASSLLVAGGGACEFTRVFDWGGLALQEAIAQELDVHSAEAATILRHLALSGSPRPLASLDDEARGRAVDAVRSKLTPFARELVSSLQFYQTQPDSLGIGEIVITGGTAHLVGLGESLHQMIGVNVRVGDPLQRVVLRTGLDPAIEATVGSLAVPIGLAIEDEALRSVNLLPTDLLQAGRKKPNIVSLALPVAAAVPVAALGFLFFQANDTVGDRQAEVEAVQAQIASLPKPKVPIIDDSVAATEAARAVALAGVLGGRVSWDGVLRDVSLVLPGDVSLTRLQAQLPLPTPPSATPGPGAAVAPTMTAGTPAVPAAPTGVKVEGYTSDQQSVARLLARLRTVPSLSNVQLESSKRETIGRKTIVSFVVLADITQLGGVQ